MQNNDLVSVFSLPHLLSIRIHISKVMLVIYFKGAHLAFSLHL